MYKIKKQGDTFIEYQIPEGFKPDLIRQKTYEQFEREMSVNKNNVYFQAEIPNCDKKYWKLENDLVVEMTAEEKLALDTEIQNKEVNDFFHNKKYYIFIYDEKELFKQAFIEAVIMKNEILAQVEAGVSFVTKEVIYINKELGQTRTAWHIFVDFVEVPETSNVWELTTIVNGESVKLVEIEPNPVWEIFNITVNNDIII